MSEIKSLNFLPENLQGEEFYTQLCQVVDYILDKYHTQNIDILRALYDIKNSNFDHERILHLLGSENFVQFDLSEDQFKILCILLSNLYEIKGTKKGLRYLLHLLNLDANVYEWYDINKAHSAGDPLWPEEVPRCSIVLELVTGTPFGICDQFSKWAIPKTGAPEEELLPPGKAFEDVEGKFAEFASKLLWVCVKLHEIRWMIRFEEYVTTTSQLTYSDEYVFYSKYSPYVTNCGYDSLQIGFPVFNNFPTIGTAGVKIGDYQYLSQPLTIRTNQEYTQPINYDGWENTGFIGQSTEEISVPIIGNASLEIGKNFYWNPLNSYPVWYKIGESRTTGSISEGTKLISGCAPSKIESVLSDIDFSTQYAIKHGIVIDPERSIGAGYIIGEDPGDILIHVDTLSLEDVQYTSETNLQYVESELYSNISDLYTHWKIGDAQLLVGDVNIRIGIDYFVEDLQIYESDTLQETFYTSCRQIGNWGYAGSGSIGIPSVIGTSVVIGGPYTLGVGQVIGAGYNYIGDCAPYDAQNIAQNQNLIVDHLVEILPVHEIEENVAIVENTEAISQYDASESFLMNTFQYLIGAGWYIGTSGATIGNTDPPQLLLIETGEVFLSNPEDGVNPAYFTLNETGTYEYDPLMNPYNIISSTFNFTIEED
ncbi:MAG: hypothetical protein WC511_02945 [Candidatus Pacearchaeota archaeon]